MIFGSEKEIIFRQNHPVGWQGISDFTHATKLNVTTQKEKLEHWKYLVAIQEHQEKVREDPELWVPWEYEKEIEKLHPP